MSKKTILISFPIILLFGIYFMGPEPDLPKWNSDKAIVPQDPDALEKYITDNESKHKLKEDNQARIVWLDSSRRRTPYSVVYIHGFFSSQGEGDPIHKDFAKTFGCNLYLARMADHGIDTTEQLLYFTSDRWWKSAKEALAIGKAIGDKVIIMSTSTGGTMGLILAAEYPQDVFALINMSPNIALRHPLAGLSNNPWGLQLARFVMDGKYFLSPLTPGADSVLDKRYWNHKFRLEATTQLQEMLESKMNKSTFEKVKCPSLTLYYYKNEQEQDPQVKVSAMFEMSEQLATPDSLKATIAIPNAGGHVLGSYVVSKDLPTVKAEIRKFALQKLRMKSVRE